MEYKTIENEVWKPIEGYEEKYEVSNLGRIYSIPRNGTYGGIIAQHKDKDGYMTVSLSCGTGKKKKSLKYRVHRLVAQAFIPNDDPVGKPLVNHLNFDRADNRVENLEWASYQRNRNYQKED